jgi:cystathionine beta-lyase
MDRHEENAKQVAAFLKEHPLVQEVFYPGLEEHSQYDLAKKQMTGFGGMVSFKLKGGKDDVSLFFRNLKLFHLAVSLGGVESLACHPASMTHGTIPDQKREQLGITDNLIRLSVGIEHINNLLEDLNQALNSVKQAVLV